MSINRNMTLNAYPPAHSNGRDANLEIVAVLDLMCQEIELPPSRVDDARDRYETVGRVLASEGSALYEYRPRVYAQGSIGLGTTVKPLKTHEFDVDLACAFALRPSSDPNEVKRAVFSMLNNQPHYKGKVETKARCVQLTYADEFHMDIMPCVPASGTNVHVPDKRAGGWVLSNPEGYAEKFHETAKELPRQRTELVTLNSRAMMEAKQASVDPFPEFDSLNKMPLQRCVQLEKRHRDKMFYEDKSKAPSSIIITTLTVYSYAYAVRNNRYDHPLELMIDVVEGLPNFIKVIPLGSGVTEYIVTNPVLPSENFASKWKEDKELPENFFAWQQRAAKSLRRLAEMEEVGLNELGRQLGSDYGQDTANTAIREFSKAIEESSREGNLQIITNPSTLAPQGHRVPRHTNFGA